MGLLAYASVAQHVEMSGRAGVDEKKGCCRWGRLEIGRDEQALAGPATQTCDQPLEATMGRKIDRQRLCPPQRVSSTSHWPLAQHKAPPKSITFV